MKHITNKKHSIFTYMLILLVISAAVSVLFFFMLQISGEDIVLNYLENSTFVEETNKKKVEELQRYITEEQVSSRDTSALSAWVKDQRIMSISIFKDGIQVFDSSYPDKQIWENEIAATNYEWEDYYSLVFLDGKAEISISGAYDYQLNNYVLIISLLLSFVLFLVIVLAGIKRKMDYILSLRNEVEILEGGNLDYKISVKGKDELAVLAESLDSMRVSIRDLMRQEDELKQKYQKLVTEMAHDIRTPITSIMLYTEILNKGKYKSEEHLKNYLEKINIKAMRMKFLTDQLFNYSLQVQDEPVVLEPPESFTVVFYDILSEACHYLLQKGFPVVMQNNIKWLDTPLQINTEYIIRIVDNIVSNMVKYADPASSIDIDTIEEAEFVGISFTNKMRQDSDANDSTGIGLQNIRNMMTKMGGECLVEQQDRDFQISLRFPICQEEENNK